MYFSLFQLLYSMHHLTNPDPKDLYFQLDRFQHHHLHRQEYVTIFNKKKTSFFFKRKGNDFCVTYDRDISEFICYTGGTIVEQTCCNSKSRASVISECDNLIFHWFISKYMYTFLNISGENSIA